MTRYKAVHVIACLVTNNNQLLIKGWNMRADAVVASGLESDTSKTRTCEAKKDLERGTNSVESNLVAIGFRDS